LALGSRMEPPVDSMTPTLCLGRILLGVAYLGCSFIFGRKGKSEDVYMVVCTYDEIGRVCFDSGTEARFFVLI